MRQAAERNGVSLDAALTLLDSLARSGGSQAQFNHPDLGGMGQWSQGGMIMIGDMFNQGLKSRVDALCNDLSSLLRSQPSIQAPNSPSQSRGSDSASSNWWPSELRSPASSGAQNDMRYAFFPHERRLAIQQGGNTRVYDTGEHNISGYSQQQGGGQSATFTSQFGLVTVADLPMVQGEREEARPTPETQPAYETPRQQANSTSRNSSDDILTTIERLAELRKKDILTEQEFAAKKAELLARLQ